MSTAPVKSQPLHNFSLPFLKWGGTGTAKSYHAADAAAATSNNHNHNHRFRRPDHEPGTRPARTNRFALSPSPPNHNNNDDENDEVASVAVEAEAAAEEAVQKPWNLRPRKPALPFSAGAWRSGNGEVQEPGVPVHGEAKSTRLRGMTTVAEGAQCSTEKKRKFWIELSKDEIVEDFFVITGSRPNRRPKKRPKNVQKQMDSIYPGLWLVGVSADAYRVEDTPAKR